ncbi:MAG: YqaA family protein [Candidatus Omnitrophota bacterium]
MDKTENKILFIIRAPLRWIRRLYDWTIHWSKKKQAPYALFAISFIESSFFPIPPDVLLIAMVIANRKKWLRYAAICTIGSACGALLGYLIGWAFYETIGKAIINTYNLKNVVEIIRNKYQENAFLTIFTAAFTPIPYKAITITAGLFRIPLTMLIFASVIGRAGRFFLVSGALRIFGKKISESIEKYFDIFSIIFTLLLIGGVLALKYAF